jgi:hypothetical protein
MQNMFAPGCALALYKPALIERLHRVLESSLGPMLLMADCCRNQPALAAGTEVVNVCPGCDRRYRQNYAESSTVSVWEVLAARDTLPLPDYGGRRMSILDACPTRERTGVHDAIRALLERMNITLVEPEHTRTTSVCCGDSAWGEAPVERVKRQMVARAAQMPAEEVVVYCVSCVKSVAIGGKSPRYLVDLLFGEATIPGELDPDAWHRQLDDFQPRCRSQVQCERPMDDNGPVGA